METVKDVFTSFRQQLQHLYDAQELEAITLWVLNEVTSRSNAQLKAFPETSVTEKQIQLLLPVLEKLNTGMPVQYALGRTEFYGLSFKVAPVVLIPRPETEELIAWVLDEASQQPHQQQVLDIGTGSGCIAISLKKNLPASQVAAMDISTAALRIAIENALINDVEVDFMEADILNPSSYTALSLPAYDLIVSNPPYVTLTDKQQMHNRVTDFEPHTALFVPEHEPLLFYKAIADFSLTKLKANGLLFFEINESYGEETVNMLAYKGLKDIELRKDMYGKMRMIKATR